MFKTNNKTVDSLIDVTCMVPCAGTGNHRVYAKPCQTFIYLFYLFIYLFFIYS